MYELIDKETIDYHVDSSGLGENTKKAFKDFLHNINRIHNDEMSRKDKLIDDLMTDVVELRKKLGE